MSEKVTITGNNVRVTRKYKKRAPSKQVKCDECGKMFPERGIHAHKRQKHLLPTGNGAIIESTHLITLPIIIKSDGKGDVTQSMKDRVVDVYNGRCADGYCGECCAYSYVVDSEKKVIHWFTIPVACSDAMKDVWNGKKRLKRLGTWDGI